MSKTPSLSLPTVSSRPDVYVSLPTHMADAEVGAFFTATNVIAGNVINDFRENIRNLLGGRMGVYSELMHRAVSEAIDVAVEAAKAEGYDGLTDLRIVSPKVAEGGVEIVIYANGFKQNTRKFEGH